MAASSSSLPAPALKVASPETCAIPDGRFVIAKKSGSGHRVIQVLRVPAERLGSGGTLRGGLPEGVSAELVDSVGDVSCFVAPGSKTGIWISRLPDKLSNSVAVFYRVGVPQSDVASLMGPSRLVQGSVEEATLIAEASSVPGVRAWSGWSQPLIVRMPTVDRCKEAWREASAAWKSELDGLQTLATQVTSALSDVRDSLATERKAKAEAINNLEAAEASKAAAEARAAEAEASKAAAVEAAEARAAEAEASKAAAEARAAEAEASKAAAVEAAEARAAEAEASKAAAEARATEAEASKAAAVEAAEARAAEAEASKAAAEARATEAEASKAAAEARAAEAEASKDAAVEAAEARAAEAEASKAAAEARAVEAEASKDAAVEAAEARAAEAEASKAAAEARAAEAEASKAAAVEAAVARAAEAEASKAAAVEAAVARATEAEASKAAAEARAAEAEAGAADAERVASREMDAASRLLAELQALQEAREAQAEASAVEVSEFRLRERALRDRIAVLEGLDGAAAAASDEAHRTAGELAESKDMIIAQRYTIDELKGVHEAAVKRQRESAAKLEAVLKALEVHGHGDALRLVVSVLNAPARAATAAGSKH
ncbi:hypothetical protein FNF29_04096 [Cafeteria roenbergensis]|uniref:Uncharacterized protein n=1 Tax=Cafeteria roenbergensis TaxID=33653 RepID=A0A5A8CGP0_CAFRO|nr:hypothetical protein FNF29_04096 [Cafeteria roenbergensis]|eukprot:KAA0152232.1 hypothetical protein FNF29_04096 [Cafeteria roenbergensis]